MTVFSPQQLIEMRRALPPKLLDVYTSETTTDKVMAIAEKHGLNVEQSGQLVNEIGYALLGATPLNELSGKIEGAVGISNEVAGLVVKDINTEIFGPIREDLKNVGSQEGGEEHEPQTTREERADDPYRESVSDEDEETPPSPPPPAPSPRANVSEKKSSGENADTGEAPSDMPENVKSVYESNKVKEVVENAKGKYKLEPNQAAVLTSLINSVLEGSLAQNQLLSEINRRFSLQVEIASNLVEEIHSSIFFPIKSQLNSYYKEKHPDAVHINEQTDDQESTQNTPPSVSALGEKEGNKVPTSDDLEHKPVMRTMGADVRRELHAPNDTSDSAAESASHTADTISPTEDVPQKKALSPEEERKAPYTSGQNTSVVEKKEGGEEKKVTPSYNKDPYQEPIEE